MEEPIGEGAFSVVWKAIYRGRRVAVKQLKDRELVKTFVKELYGLWFVALRCSLLATRYALCCVLTHLQRRTRENTHVIKCLGASTYPYFCILTEYMDRGSLYDLRLKSAFSAREILRIALCVAEGVQLMHSMKPQLIHRDLTPQNILMDGAGNVKVTRFEHASNTLRMR
jgi:serine/threonine protein kinase